MPQFPRTKVRTLGAVVGTTAVLASGAYSPAMAQDRGDNVLVAFSHAGVDAMLADPNDEGLKQALGMIVPRFLELQSSDADFARDLQQVPPEMIRSVAGLFSAPLTLVVTSSPEPDPDTGAPVFHALISFDMDEAQARQLHANLEGVRQMAGDGGPEFRESERFAGMMQTFTPMGPLTFGPRDSGNGWRYEVMFGPDLKPDLIRSMLPTAPRGTRQLSSGVVDLEALTPLTNMGAGFLSMASPQGASAVQRLRESGLIGDGAIRFEMTSWTDGTTNTTQVVSKRARNFRESMYIPDATLTPADLAIIPADATAAYIAKFSPRMMTEGMLEDIGGSLPRGGEEIEEALAAIERELGIDVMGEFVPALGDTVAMYFSDSTGGGSLLSGIVAIKSADRAKLREIITRLENRVLREWAREDPAGGAAGPRVIRSTHNGNPMVTYRFSGLPIPIAPSMTIIDDWFVMGLSPQAAMAASEATGRRNGRGLLDNPRFAKAYKSQPETVSLSFVDTERTLRDGVPTLSLLSAALGNMVTSARNDGPALKSVMPSMRSLMDNPQPLIQQSFWKGDDMVQLSTTDASAMVSISAVLGVGDAAPLIGGMILGGGLGAAIAEEFGGGFDRGWDEPDWDDDWDDEMWDEGDNDPEF